MMETQSIAAPIIMVAAGIGVPLCLFAAFIIGVGGVSGNRDPLFAGLLALSAVGLPATAFALLHGEPSVIRTTVAVILGALPLTFIAIALFRIIRGE